MKYKKAFFFFVIFLCLVACGELLARVAFQTVLPKFEKVRQVLAGEASPRGGFLNAIGQPYLVYIPAPDYADGNGLQHNAHGYRGKAVTLDRTPGVARILCLGGSTTYGWGVNYPEQAYPAQLEKLLNEKLPGRWKGIEVINAGAPSATTAEMLTYYHFKFHFYKPDLVILQPGGNDALGLVAPYYHPDYSHWRKPMLLSEPLPVLGRMALKSRLFDLFFIPLLMGPKPGGNSFVRTEGFPPPAPWYTRTPGANPKQELPPLKPEELAFRHNLEALLELIQKDGPKVVLMPFRPAPNNTYVQGIRAAMQQEESTLQQLAKQYRLPMAPLPLSAISTQNWIDDCHNNAEGNLEKARHLEPLVRAALAGN